MPCSVDSSLKTRYRCPVISLHPTLLMLEVTEHSPIAGIKAGIFRQKTLRDRARSKQAQVHVCVLIPSLLHLKTKPKHPLGTQKEPSELL